jgi:hypothetical protein
MLGFHDGKDLEIYLRWSTLNSSAKLAHSAPNVRSKKFLVNAI